MSDDGEMLDDWNAAVAVGEKVLEMCDRVKVAHRCAPGACARSSVEVDGTTYDIEVSVRGAAPK